jgi:chemotaxis protein MotB
MRPGAEAPAHDEHEGWLVSYADMITLLLGLFVMLYSFSKVDDETYDRVSRDIAKAFDGEGAKRPADANSHATSEARQARALRLLAGLLGTGPDTAAARIEQAAAAKSTSEAAKQLLASGAVDVGAVSSGGAPNGEAVIELALPAELLFAAGSATLAPAAAAKLATLAGELRLIPGMRLLEIKGHTDGVVPRAGVDRDNWALSAARAGAVASALIAGGIDKALVRASGYANLRPLFPEEDGDGRPLAENRAKNRRVEIVVRKAADGPR